MNVYMKVAQLIIHLGSFIIMVLMNWSMDWASLLLVLVLTMLFRFVEFRAAPPDLKVPVPWWVAANCNSEAFLIEST